MKRRINRIIIPILVLVIPILFFIVPIFNGRTAYSILTYKDIYYDSLSDTRQEAYDKMQVEEVKITERKTGSPNFNTDTRQSIDDGSVLSNMEGIDVSEKDDYVRTFDTVSYVLEVSVEENPNADIPEGTIIKGGVIKVKATIPKGPNGEHYATWERHAWMNAYQTITTDTGYVLTAEYYISDSASIVGGSQELSFSFRTYGYITQLIESGTKPTFEVWMEGNQPDNSLSKAQSQKIEDENNLYITGKENYEVEIKAGKINMPAEENDVSGQYINYGINVYLKQPYSYVEGIIGVSYPTVNKAAAKINLEYYYNDTTDTDNTWILIDDDDPQNPLNGAYVVASNPNEEKNENAKPFSNSNVTYSSYGKTICFNYSTVKPTRSSICADSGEVSGAINNNMLLLDFTNFEMSPNIKFVGGYYYSSFPKSFLLINDAIEIFVPHYKSGESDYDYQVNAEIKEFLLINDENEKTSIFPDNSSYNDKVSINFQKNSGNAIDVNISYLERIDTGTWSTKNTAVVGNSVGYFEIDLYGNHSVFYGGATRLLTWNSDLIELNSADHDYNSPIKSTTFKYGIYQKNVQKAIITEEEINTAVVEDFIWYSTKEEALKNGIISAVLADDKDWKGYQQTVKTRLSFKIKNIGSNIGKVSFLRQKVYLYPDEDRTEVVEYYTDSSPTSYIPDTFTEYSIINSGTPMDAGHTYLLIGERPLINAYSYDMEKQTYKGIADVSDEILNIIVKPSFLNNDEYDDDYELIADLIITVQIPNGLTYVENSSTIEPSTIGKDAENNTYLQWVFENYSMPQNMEPFFFQVEINPFLENNTKLVLYSYIASMTTSEQSTKIIDIGDETLEIPIADESNSGINFSNLSGSSNRIHLEKGFLEVNEDLEIKSTAYNSSDKQLTNIKTIQRMPYNGDIYGSDFEGTYTLIINTIADRQDVYYTTNLFESLGILEDEYGNYSAKNIDFSTDAKWKRVEVGDSIPSGVTAIASTISSLDTGTSKAYSYQFIPSGNTYGNHYSFRTFMTSDNLVSITSSYIKDAVVGDRQISGIAFIDKNENNIFDSPENVYEGLTIYLLDENKNIISTTTTDSTGYYEFSHLSKLHYYIKIDQSNNYEIVEKNADLPAISSTLNNDGYTDLITNLNVELSSELLEEDNVNIGLRPKEATLTVHHYIEGTTKSLAQSSTSTLLWGDEYTTSEASVDSNYELVETPSNASGTIAGNTTVTYYYKLKTATITVHHYIKGSTTKLADDVVTTQKYTTTYSTKVASVDSNYELVETPSNASGTVNGDITVTYYYQLKKGTITVHHYIKGTTNKLADDVVTTQNYTTEYKTKAATVDSNYELVSTPSNASGTVSGNVTVTYYYQLKKGTITVHHYIENTTTKLADDVVTIQEYTTTYTTTPATVNKNYELVKTPSNATGTVNGDITVIYYYKLKTATLTVNHYIEGTTTKLSKTTTQSLNWGDEYTTSRASDISTNYELVSTPSNANGIIAGDVVVNYYYSLKEATLTVHHYIEGTTTELSKTTTKVVNWGDKYETSPASDINTNYELVSTPSNASGTIAGNTTVIYYYKLKTATITVHHYIKGTTDKLADDVVTTQKYTTTYSTKAASVDTNYELVETPSNASGTVSGNVTVTYYYQLKTATLTVNHYVQGTTTKLSDTVTKTMNWGEEYTTSVATDISENYELVSTPSNSSGTIAGDVTVNYYYKLKEGTLTIHYYVKGTTTKLSNSITKSVHWGDKYETSPATDINENYELVSTPSNATGTISANETIVIYYYQLKTATLTVNYYIEGTTTKLSNTLTETMNWGETYTTSSASDISENYKLVSTPTNSTGTIKGDVTVNYYYRLKEAKVTVNYYIEGTTTKLADSIIQELNWGDEYETSPSPDVSNNYELVSTPSNATGTIKDDAIVVNYYYRLKEAKLTVHHYIEGTTEKLTDSETSTIYWGDQYTTEQSSKVSSNYEIVSVPSNATGTVSGDVTVIYYYRLKTATITVYHYIEGTTTRLADSESFTKKYTEEYTTNPSTDIDPNYEVVSTPSNANGTVSGNVTVIYYYKLKTATLTVHHYIEGTTTSLAADEISTVTYTHTYQTSQLKENNILKNYELASTQGTLQGTVSGNIEVTYYYKLKSSTLVVKHLEYGTNKELAQEERKTLKYTDEYETSVSTSVPGNYEYYSKTDNYKGVVATDNIEVIYYYQEKDSRLSTTITIKAPEEITNKTQKVNYKLEYTSTINDYRGSGTTTIIVQLPYHIDENKSDLNGGTYNSELKTITWITTEEDINATSEQKVISGNKDFSVTFSDLVLTDRTMNTSVTSHIKLENNERNAEDNQTTYIKIQGKIIVHHYIEGTTTKVVDDVETTNLVGETYVSESIEKKGYLLKKEPENKNHIYQDETQEIIYEYERLKFNIITKVEGGEGNIKGDETVFYGDNSTEGNIVIKPNKGYQVSHIIVNGEEKSIEECKNGCILNNFIEVYEDKEIIVIFEALPNNPETSSIITITSVIGLTVLSTGAYILVKKYKPSIKKI